MANTTETGHTKNVTNLESLITSIIALGTTYNPSRNSIKLTALQTLLNVSKESLNIVNIAQAAYSNAVAARKVAFQTIANLPTKGLIEGPFTFEQNGKYYLTYPHVENQIERLEYVMSDSPMGPYKTAGVIMDESVSGCWTNHQSIVEYKGQWYLFYHDKDYSPKFDKNRSVRIDSLFFNADGTIQKVKPTFRGVGLTKATDKIQLDRYSGISDKGAMTAYIDTLNYFDGWKTILSRKNTWVQYNAVDFGTRDYKCIEMRYKSHKGGILVLIQNSKTGKTKSIIKIPASAKWTTVSINLSGILAGIQNLILTNAGNNPVEIDWICFK